MDYNLGYFDDETCRLEPIDNPFGPKLLPMSPEWTFGKWSGRLDSNQRPPAPKAGALPGCATPRPEELNYPTHANPAPIVTHFEPSDRSLPPPPRLRYPDPLPPGGRHEQHDGVRQLQPSRQAVAGPAAGPSPAARQGRRPRAVGRHAARPRRPVARGDPRRHRAGGGVGAADQRRFPGLGLRRQRRTARAPAAGRARRHTNHSHHRRAVPAGEPSGPGGVPGGELAVDGAEQAGVCGRGRRVRARRRTGGRGADGAPERGSVREGTRAAPARRARRCSRTCRRPRS